MNFTFFDPSDVEAVRNLTNKLERFEGGYFPDMRVGNGKACMTASKFVRYIRPWGRADRAQYENTIIPHAIKATRTIMRKVTGAEFEGEIILARVDSSVEHGFPWTLANFISLGMPRGETVLTKKKTLVHEIIHILQRFFPSEFDVLYRKEGFVKVSRDWTAIVRNFVDASKKIESISNPDSYKGNLYATPLDEKANEFLVTNLALDPENGNYRELGFIANRRKEIVEWNWLGPLISKLIRTDRGHIPKRSLEIFDLMKRHQFEGHPNEIWARILEKTGL